MNKNNSTDIITKLSRYIAATYQADFTVSIIRDPQPYMDDTKYQISIKPWKSDKCISIEVSNFEIRNTNVSDLINLKIQLAMKLFKEEN